MTTAVSPADYHGEAVAGKRWLRAYRLIISNPYLGVPSIAIDEEQVTQIDTAVSAKFNATLTADVTDLTAVVDLIDPTTGEPTGTATTYGDVYVALYSLYRALAAHRDETP